VDPVYLIVRPEIKASAELKGKPAGITRYGSTTHFYLRQALRNIGLDERDILIVQLGAGPEMVVALHNGAIAAAALTHRYALPFLERGWPVLVDLSKTDLVYPSSCVTSSRDFIKAEPAVVQNFLRGYVAGINLIKKDHGFAQKSFAKWMREKDLAVVKKTVETYARLYKPAPYVPDKGIDNVLKDMVVKRPELKQYLGWPEFFRENKPLETVLREK
jgi:NitT/TauT family transport system substrate-binding protein